ncbi:helix-turn-helix transcriptional regulator [Bifidobacterium sp. LC6]|uniref:Helix-turn-helix transcriptional regulator n=1 Tax=Bifidobacterium colobi TaxID=2809026 RepID=A0ABS5UY71_9BIFI|nr:helix-turn-helix transcriptional regulator [Bifidobacterium colobi]MBT1175622.1 helix-turn-helix transcriptional regulator [Bifidobacterium colobi]
MSTTSYQRFLWAVGRRIQTLRKSRGLSQEQLAEQLDMDRVSIGYIEQGRRSPKLATLYALAGTLGVHVSDIFAGLEYEAQAELDTADAQRAALALRTSRDDAEESERSLSV